MAAEGNEITKLEGMPAPLWRRIADDPQRAPELLALAAAQRFAEPARTWASEQHAKSPKKLARRAYKRHVRLSRAEGLVLGAGGALTSAGNVAGLGWIQARMVFFIAAAYGHDPADPMRPAELLWLWGVYDSPERARESLDGVGATMTEAVVGKALSKSDERSVANRLIRFVGKRAATKMGGRLIPILGAPISAVQNGGSTKELGREALRFYAGEDR